MNSTEGTTCACEWCSYFLARISTSTPFTVTGGTYGYDPAIQGVAMGNLDPARRGRWGYEVAR